jgi:hypothetical protein
MRIIGLYLILAFSLISNDSKPSSKEIFQENKEKQGFINFSQAQEYFQIQNYKACIQKNHDFLLLYPEHPLKIKVLKLMSEAYWMDDQSLKSISVDEMIYKEYPTIEEGLISYLEAAKKYLKIGKIGHSKKILLEIKDQMYSKKISKDAEIELEQIKILDIE